MFMQMAIIEMLDTHRQIQYKPTKESSIIIKRIKCGVGVTSIANY